jgi:hypothetical protein
LCNLLPIRRAKIKNAFLFTSLGRLAFLLRQSCTLWCGAAAPMLIDVLLCYTHADGCGRTSERPSLRDSEIYAWFLRRRASCPNHNSISIGASLPPSHSSSPRYQKSIALPCLFGLLVLMAMMLIKDLGVGDCAPRRTMDGGLDQGRGGEGT